MSQFAVRGIIGEPPTYPSRQRRWRLARAASAAAGCCVLMLVGLALVDTGVLMLGGCCMFAALIVGLHARHLLGLARRSAVGARSEQEVRRALTPLVAEGWRLRHSLPWHGGGDIDSVAISPTGIAVVIETKTRTYERRHLGQVREQAAWLARRRRRWARRGVLGVLCLVRARGVERVEHDVLVVSVDRLIHVLRVAAVMRRGSPSND